MNHHRISPTLNKIATVAIVAMLVVMAIQVLQAESNESDPQLCATTAMVSNRVAISASCASSGCHGGTSDPAWRQAYSVWATRDPHADAYRVLERTVSRNIVAKLNAGKSLDDESYHQFIQKNCAACHATGITPAMLDNEKASPVRSQLLAGVACEACHGAADGWLDKHITVNPPAQSQAVIEDAAPHTWTLTNPEYGLRQLKDHVTLARTCVTCHVGSPGDANAPRREVNHDLIAAGHPRLAFEYTSHLANLPPHWDSQGESLTARDQWAIGQLVAADAAIDLLLARVESGVWPEFAEYNCAACHHALQGVDVRPASASAALRGSFYDWGSWYCSLAVAATPQGERLAADLELLSAEMSPVAPSKNKVRQAATNVQQQLRQAIAQLSNGQDDPALADRIQSTAVDDSSPMEWDFAVQYYLWHAHRQPQGEEALARLFDELDPKVGHNGPLWLHYQPNNLRQLFQQLDLPPSIQP